MKVRFNRQFSKQYKKAPSKTQSIFDKRLKTFLKNPFHWQLHNHSLKGKLQGYRSINVTGDWRAIYSQKGEVVIFELLGTHSQLYK